jgi:predicted branched-subunit amino acid permease
MYSAAMAPILSPLPRRWSGAVAFLLTDQAFAAAIRKYDSHGDAKRAALHYAGSGMALWTFWQVTNAVGFYVGNVIPAAWSLEFAVPLCFLALLAPALRGAPHVLAAIVAGVAVMALDALPMRLNLVVAGLLGIVAGLAVEMAEARWKAR